jgi:hypothetical protein
MLRRPSRLGILSVAIYLSLALIITILASLYQVLAEAPFFHLNQFLLDVLNQFLLYFYRVSLYSLLFYVIMIIIYY